MTKFVKMLECCAGGTIVVEHDVGDAGDFDVR